VVEDHLSVFYSSVVQLKAVNYKLFYLDCSPIDKVRSIEIRCSLSEDLFELSTEVLY